MKPIESARFGKAALDYARYRHGFPESLFRRLAQWLTPSLQVVDLGTGTGTLARGFAQQGHQVVGIDPDQSMLEAARRIDDESDVTVDYRSGTAEKTGLADGFADVVTAGQCWHWFDRPRAAAEIRRILKPDGVLVIAHYDWIPLDGNVVRRTEELIERYNPAWRGGNQTGIHGAWFRDVGEAGFAGIESFTYDEPAIYTHESWRGRVRASAGVGATLDKAEVARFDAGLAALLAREFPDEPLAVPHRVFALIARRGER